MDQQADSNVSAELKQFTLNFAMSIFEIKQQPKFNETDMLSLDQSKNMGFLSLKADMGLFCEDNIIRVVILLVNSGLSVIANCSPFTYGMEGGQVYCYCL